MVNGIITAVKKVVSKKTRSVSAVIVAGGKSQRMRGVNKIFMPVGDEPLIVETIRAFESCKKINEIIVVLSEEDRSRGEMLVEMQGFSKVRACAAGGATRAESSYNGVCATSKEADYIVIHDGARPLVTEELIVATIDAAVKQGAATVAIPATSTIKRCIDGIVDSTVDRENLFEIQTPQAFRGDVLKAALKNAMDKQLAITDDCMAVEAIGLKPAIVDGLRSNIKVTVPEDAVIAKALLESRRNKL